MQETLCLLLEKVDDLTELVKAQPCKNCKHQLLPWLSKSAVMQHLQISKGTYYKWRKIGILKPSSTIGEDRFLPEVINRIIAGKGRRKRRRSE